MVALWWVMAAFVMAVLDVVAPAEVVLVPAVVPAPSLPAANSLLCTNNSLARLVGPAAGGLLYAASGLPAVAVMSAVSFAVAALLVSRVRVTAAAGDAHPVLLTGHPLVYPALWPALVLIAVTGLPPAAVAAAEATKLQVLLVPPHRSSRPAHPPSAAG